MKETVGCFTNVLWAPQNILAKIHNTRNHIYGDNFNLKICTCAQSKALGIRTKFQLEILITSTIYAIHKFWENFLESSRNVSETTPRCPKCMQRTWWATSSNALYMVGRSGQKAPKVPRMKSFTLENIRVSKVPWKNLYAYNNAPIRTQYSIRVTFHTCNFSYV